MTSPTLTTWLLNRLETLHATQAPLPTIGNPNVTVLAYHFWQEIGYDEAFRLVEGAIRETWLHCGMMKTVIVVNIVRPCVQTFAEHFSPWVEIQVESALTPGVIYTMSVDCNSKLHTRFKTPYVLIVQNDGFPLRPGLDEFLGKYDFVGAPCVRDLWWTRLICKPLGAWVSNGGFSLRTHNICERAAYFWNKKYHSWPDCRAISEDMFYTETLILREWCYRKNVHIADNRIGFEFSYGDVLPPPTQQLPFGFHGTTAFAKLGALLHLE